VAELGQTAAPTLAQRVGEQSAPTHRRENRGGPGRGPPGRGGPGRGGQGGRGGRGGRGGNHRPAKTVEDLDAEMEDYAASNAEPEAPAA